MARRAGRAADRRATTKERTTSASRPANTRRCRRGVLAAQVEDYYPELVLHGYPGISRAELFADAQQAVNSLGGWKIANVDRDHDTLDCVYTSRIFRSEDDIRIVVTAKNRIFVCSRSRSRLFPGDFGANIGHIKEFQEAVEPSIEKFYNELKDKMRGRDNGQRS